MKPCCRWSPRSSAPAIPIPGRGHFRDSIAAGYWCQLLVTPALPGDPRRFGRCAAPARRPPAAGPSGRDAGHLETHLLNITTVPQHRRQLRPPAAGSPAGLVAAAGRRMPVLRCASNPARARLYERSVFARSVAGATTTRLDGAQREDAVIMSLRWCRWPRRRAGHERYRTWPPAAAASPACRGWMPPMAAMLAEMGGQLLVAGGRITLQPAPNPSPQLRAGAVGNLARRPAVLSAARPGSAAAGLPTPPVTIPLVADGRQLSPMPCVGGIAIASTAPCGRRHSPSQHRLRWPRCPGAPSSCLAPRCRPTRPRWPMRSAPAAPATRQFMSHQVPVPGMGDLAPDWLIVGEAPARRRTARACPSSVAPGQLLDRMLAAMGLDRQHKVHIANVIQGAARRTTAIPTGRDRAVRALAAAPGRAAAAPDSSSRLPLRGAYTLLTRIQSGRAPRPLAKLPLEQAARPGARSRSPVGACRWW